MPWGRSTSRTYLYSSSEWIPDLTSAIAEASSARHRSSLRLPMASVNLRPVQVPQQGDLRPVMQRVAGDVEYERRKRIVRVRALGGAARPGEAFVAESAHAFDPGVVGAVELRQRLVGGAGILERVPADGRAAEMGGVTRPEYAHDYVRQPPRDGRDRRRIRFRRRVGALLLVLAPPHPPNPPALGALDVPRLRRLQQPGTGSQKYSASVRPLSLGRSWFCQCQSSCSASSLLQSMSMPPEGRRYCGQFLSSICGRLAFMLETSARLLRLLGLLQLRPEWPGPELADRLGVTVRTLRRDVQRLRDLDYPVHSVPGVAGGYRLCGGKALPPLLLGDDEAVAGGFGLGRGGHPTGARLA